MAAVLAGICAAACAPRPSEPAAEPAPAASSPTEATVVGPAVFEDRAAATGLDFTHFNGMTGSYLFPEVMGSGCALVDVDGDGDLDAYLVQGAFLEPGKGDADALIPPPAGPLVDRLFLNRLVESGELRFDDVTATSGIEAAGYGRGVAVGDADGDGWPDIYVTNVGSNQLWRNRGDGTFEDATERAGADDRRWSVPAVFLDYDRDGRLDLFVGNYVDFDLATHDACKAGMDARDYCGPGFFEPAPDRLLHNRGAGRFTDVTLAAGMGREYGRALGAVAGDFDDDGRPDLYVANDWTPNQMWMNTGSGFENRALLGGTALNGKGAAEAGMGVDVADYDRDGDEDIFVTHLSGETNTLYRNQGGSVFSDVSQLSMLGGPSLPTTGFGTAFFDFDNDGWLDVVVFNGAVSASTATFDRAVRGLESGEGLGGVAALAQPNHLYRGHESGEFENVSARGGDGFRELEVSRGAAFGDVDNDGDIDVLVSNNSGPARLLINGVGQESRWIGLALRSDGGVGIGSVVTVTTEDGAVLRRRVRTSMSYASSSDPRVLVGLGAAGRVAEVRVRWLEGGYESYGALEPGRYHVLRRGAGKPAG
ncbi:MAG: CRTAC1 family protein [Thermoanaerobaculia bacterium]|nr:CRTAC1 family protein [Thermoanaerobaculia bacterium]